MTIGPSFVLLVAVVAGGIQETMATSVGQDLHLSYHSSIDGTTQPYRIYIPSTYDDDHLFPLVVTLHGTTGDENTFFENAHYLKTPIVQAAERYGVIVVCPYGRGAKEYRGIGEQDVFAVIEDVSRRYRIDEDRIYITGHSMGGTGAAYLALHHPDIFAAAAPLAAAWGFPWLAPNGRHVPFWWIGGAEDQKPFLEGVRLAVEAMRASGTTVQHTILPSVGHYGPVADMDAVVAWLSQHRRTRSPAEYTFVVDTPLHGQAYRTRVDDLLEPGRIGTIRVQHQGERLEVTTENVAAIAIYADPERTSTVFYVDGQLAFRGELASDQEIYLDRRGNTWRSRLAQSRRRDLTDFHVAPVGTAPRELGMGGTESSLASWIADAMRIAVGADIAIINRQYYRGQPIPAGTVDMVDILNAMSVFDQYIVTTRLTGGEILEILDDNVPDPAKDRSFVKDGPEADRLAQVSGARYSFDPTCPSGERIVETDLTREKVYTVAFQGQVVERETVLLAGKFGKLQYTVTDTPLSLALYGHARKGHAIAPLKGWRVREVAHCH